MMEILHQKTICHQYVTNESLIYVNVKFDGNDSTTPTCCEAGAEVEHALKGVPVLSTIVNKGSVRIYFKTVDQLKVASEALSPALGQDILTVTGKTKEAHA